MLETILTLEGFVVESVQNGREAVDRLAIAKYDTLLLDLKMPEMNGIEVVNYLADHSPEILQRCVIVLTAVSEKEARASFEGKAVYRVLRKPFEIPELLSTIRECSATTPPATNDDSSDG